METSALMGMNVAQLITEDYRESMGETHFQDSTSLANQKATPEEL